MTTSIVLTANLTNGLTSVTVPSGAGVSELIRGGIVTIPSTGAVNAVDQITGTTTLDLVLPYEGATDTGVEVIVTLIPVQSVRALHAQQMISDRLALETTLYRAASNSYAFAYDAQTTVASPGAGGLRFNNADPASASVIVVSRETLGGLDESDLMMADVAGGDVAIQVNAQNFRFNANVTSTVDNGGWIRFNLANPIATGVIEAGKHVAVSLNRRGLQGLTGPTPDAGTFDVVSETDFPSETVTILLTGQSNALGRNAGGRQLFSSLLSIWNNENDIDSATINLGDQFRTVNLSVRPFVNGAQSPLVQACNLLARTIGKNVRIIFVAAGSKVIASWSDPSGVRGAMYNRISQVMDEASVSSFDCVMMHQGESDHNAENQNDYQASWNGFVANMMTDGWITSTTPIVIGYLPKEMTRINPVLTAIAAADTRVAVAATAGFTTEFVTATTVGHYVGEAAINIGAEYVRALNTIPNTPFTGILEPVDLDGFDTVISDDSDELKRTSVEAVNDGRRKRSLSAYKIESQTGIPSATFFPVGFPAVSSNRGIEYTVTEGTFGGVPVTRTVVTPPVGRFEFKLTLQVRNLTTGGAQLAAIYKNDEIWARCQDRSNGNSQSLSVTKSDECDGLSEYEAYTYIASTSTGTVEGASAQTWFEVDEK